MALFMAAFHKQEDETMTTTEKGANLFAAGYENGWRQLEDTQWLASRRRPAAGASPLEERLERSVEDLSAAMSSGAPGGPEREGRGVLLEGTGHSRPEPVRGRRRGWLSSRPLVPGGQHRLVALQARDQRAQEHAVEAQLAGGDTCSSSVELTRSTRTGLSARMVAVRRAPRT